MQRLSSTQNELLRSSGQFAERLAFARAIGNHQIDNILMRRAILRTARRYYQAQGLSTVELDRRAPLFTPPPARHGIPTVGKVKIFALLIEFTDTQHTNSEKDIDAGLFGTPATGAPYESMAAYYKRASYDKLDFSGGSTLGWYKIDKNRADVAQTAAGREDLIKEALKHYNQEGHDFKKYDNDGDGVIDYFMVFWTGADTGWGTFWWGYQPSFTDSSFKLDGLSLGKYSWQWEANPVDSAFNPRVGIHETGHALGLPDLYDYDGDRGPDGGVGGADMMDANQYDHNGFSKWVFDWLEPTIIGSGSKTITLNSSGITQDCVVIWPGIDNDDLFSEFFFIQNRQLDGNDSEFPGAGLMIWHVDASLNAFNTNFTYDNSFTEHKLVRLMEADGKEHIENSDDHISFHAADLYTVGKRFGPTTLPASSRYSGYFSGVHVRDIVLFGNQIKATF